MVGCSWFRSLGSKCVGSALAALSLAKGATAGVIALVPVAWWLAGVGISVMIGGVAVVVAWHDADGSPSDPSTHAAVDGAGLRPGGLVPIDGRDPTRQPLSPVNDDDAPEHPNDASDRSRGFGQLELHLDGNVDLRHVRYTITYHPDPAAAQQTVYLHRPVYDAGRVQLLAAAQLQADPEAYGWEHEQPGRLCEFGLSLSASQPSCQGVVSVAPKLRHMRGGVARIRVYATRHQPLLDPTLEPAPQGFDDALSASAALRLRNAFFAVLTAVDWHHAALYRIELDPTYPDRFSAQWLPLADPMDASSSLFAQRIHRIVMARDGSRLYMTDQHVLYEWLGEPGQARLLREFGETVKLTSLAATDHGMCVARVEDERGALLCRRQAGGWSVARSIANQVRPPYEIGSCGDGVLAVERQSGQPRPLLSVYLRDARLPSLQPGPLPAVTLDASWIGGHNVRSVLPVACQPGLQEFVLAGSFEPGAGGFAPVTASLRDDAPTVATLGRPFGNAGPHGEFQNHAQVWAHPSGRIVRIFSFAAGLYATDYDLWRRRSIARQAMQVPTGWVPDGGIALLDGEGDSRYLVASGWSESDRRASLAVLRMNRFAAPAQLVAKLDFSAEMVRFGLLPGQAHVRRLTTNTVTLEPVDPDLHGDDA